MGHPSLKRNRLSQRERVGHPTRSHLLIVILAHVPELAALAVEVNILRLTYQRRYFLNGIQPLKELKSSL